jgi:hypothetical protein
MLLYKEEAIVYNYLIEIKLKQLYYYFRYLFIQKLAKVLKQAGYANIN